MKIFNILVMFITISSFRCYAENDLKCDITTIFSREIKQADSILNKIPVTVTSKNSVGHGDSLNDYISLATYWWPDSSSEDELPYIRKDGLINPETESNETDKAKLYDLRSDLRKLTFAYLLTGKEKYLAKINDYLGSWFVNPQTKMNPHMKYGQAIKGLNRGRAEGLIDAAVFVDIAHYIRLLSSNSSVTALPEIKEWYEDFLKWMLNSDIGKKEKSVKNNHGTYFDLQIVAYMLFLGKHDEAKKYAKKSVNKRIEQQIHKSGKQPLEIARSRAWHYSNYNLTAFGKVYLILYQNNLLKSIPKTNRNKLKKAYEYMIEHTEEMIARSNIDENDATFINTTNKLFYHYYLKNDHFSEDSIRKSMLSEYSIDFHLLTNIEKLKELCN